MLTGLRLPLAFEAALLRADLARIPKDAWTPHYNERDYGGVWRGVALRSTTGAVADLAAQRTGFTDTPLLARLPHLRGVLEAFACPLKGARLLALAPGSFIREHSDDALDYEHGEARIHIPIQTNPDLEFYVRGERLLLEPGGAYYVNVNLPHRVSNRGASERIHLVIDAEVNEWLRELFGRAGEIARGAPRGRGVDAFRDSIAPEARERLRAIADRGAFAAEAVRAGREAGFDFDEGDVDAAMQGEARPGAPGGLPHELTVRDGRPFLTWLDAGERPLTEPFFEQTARACLRNPWIRFSRRLAPLETHGERNTRAPRGFIFHMSRCGSTLVSQMLKAAGYRVVSEAPAVDAAVQRNPEWLRAVVAAFGAEFVKLDAWHIHKLDAIRAAFPETPWIFLHRDPAAVLASQETRPGLHALRGAMDPAALGMTAADVTSLSDGEWRRAVIAKLRAAAERHRDDPAGLFVDYSELPGAVWGAIAAHFGIALDDAAISMMREAARFDAKSPGKVFARESCASDVAGK